MNGRFRNLVLLCAAGLCVTAVPGMMFAQGVPKFQEISDNVFKLGDVTLDKRNRSITVPATVNLRKGAIEYFLVKDTGKAYESLLVTKASPYDMHMAMLLLGMKATTETTEEPPEQLTAETLKSAPELKGAPVDVMVAWKEGGKSQAKRAEEFIQNTATEKQMTEGPWLYTSSVLFKGKFMAEAEGSIIAMVRDPIALVNNPRPGNDNDLIWNIATEKVPPTGTEVEVTVKLR